jgi:hypothetical protein
MSRSTTTRTARRRAMCYRVKVLEFGIHHGYLRGIKTKGLFRGKGGSGKLVLHR